ncbi:MAG TPA: YggS family pyridoxal phosphate-dependent enzyme [Candidatus Sulfotelmatobacter sp.]|nr:YggS family pyridoxal phosphate-dependent enzyme [Candidatus Sulfotelmatobacter sp.]
MRQIAGACARVGRDPSAVELVAVSKTVPPERLRAAVAAGLTTLGENRVQELAAKAAVVPGVTWHLVGHLQANKARAALEVAAVIQAVDSVELAQRLDRLLDGRDGGPRPIYLQVNVDADPAKAGFAPGALKAVLSGIADLPHLRLAGLMTVGRLVATPEAARPTFVALRRLSDALRSREARLGAGLSMGMTDDFEVAVEEGATLVRVGRAIFGERPPAG